MPPRRGRITESHPHRRCRRAAIVAFAIAVAVVAGGACADRSETRAVESSTATIAAAGELQAQVASYDLVTQSPQRLLVGLVASEAGS